MANSEMGDDLGSMHFVFVISRNIRQNSQICQLSWNFGKPQTRWQSDASNLEIQNKNISGSTCWLRNGSNEKLRRFPPKK